MMFQQLYANLPPRVTAADAAGYVRYHIIIIIIVIIIIIIIKRS